MNSVLFVCTANRIRSPLSEHLYRRQLAQLVENIDEWEVASAGTWTHAGLPAMPLAEQAGAEIGLDLSKHRSRPIEDVALDRYQLIVTMEGGQREAISAEFPEAAPRIIQISQLAHGMDYDVADPIGQPLPAYQKTAQQLDQLVALAVRRIIELLGAEEIDDCKRDIGNGSASA